MQLYRIVIVDTDNFQEEDPYLMAKLEKYIMITIKKKLLLSNSLKLLNFEKNLFISNIEYKKNIRKIGVIKSG